ncbi:glycoside hydrolase family 88 protein [Niabella beijingensis]|uniref:glycoside hydrolase family 88 protein n=1 Tax=Niabella beijingensis TaxID=2872700 RepID=UPI001CBA70C6|nr:glycoside hydrolase family 88 protein [Niabella beijingensis]MBZ4189889.1 glycoside hydrolase family 88 protein [Niabella beijingensis]
MKRRFNVIIAGLLLFISVQVQAQANDGAAWFRHSITTIGEQLKRAAATYTPGLNPRSVNPDGTVRTAPYTDWTTGFFPGSLWYGYELTGNKDLAAAAKRFTLALDSIRFVTKTHDLGFMLYCSYGNAWRITGDNRYLPVLKEGAEHLYERFSPKTGVIRSWDFGDWKFPVIIDNMMNLEYLYWAGAQFQKPVYNKAANTHALTTLKNHFRKDYSSYHVVDYDPVTGKVRGRETHQGLSDESAWARGQAWGLYGYIMCYNNSGNPKFLQQAQHIAQFITTHPRMPENKIPVWDFDVHNALDADGRAPRDASAAAVIACGLLDLSTKMKGGEKYAAYAEEILKSLSSPDFLAQPGDNHFFILKHSVGAFLYNSEIDTPLNYADYYYLEALKKYAALKKITLPLQ